MVPSKSPYPPQQPPVTDGRLQNVKSSVSLSSFPLETDRPPLQTITEAELLAGLSADATTPPKQSAQTRQQEPSAGLFSCCFGGRTSKAAPTNKGPSGRRLSTSSRSSRSSTAGSQLFQSSTWAGALSKTASFVGFSQLVADPSTPSELLLPLGPPSVNDETYLSTPRVIGWGAEGTIRVVKRQRDGQFFVAKIFKAAKNRVHFIRGSYEYTIGYLTRGHPNLAAVIDLTRVNDLCFTIMEYVPGGNLRMALAKPGYLRNQSTVDGIFVQMCRAVLWMHAMGVAHRDIKLENILWHPRRPLVKLVDFGNADIFWTAKGFVDDTFESLSPLGSAAFDKPGAKQERHLSETILKGCGMTTTMSVGQMVTSAGGVLANLGAKKAGSGPKGKMFSAGDSDESDEDDEQEDRTDAQSSRSSIDEPDNIPKPYLDDATSPSLFYRYDEVEESEGDKITENAFKGYVPVSPSEFRRPSRYWNPATHKGSSQPPTFSAADDPTSREAPIRLSFGVVGTTAYMAPEQYGAAGRRPSPEEEVGWYDPRAVDVWMLAVAYIYTSTRRIPWSSATEAEVAFRRWREGKGCKVLDDWRDQKLPTFDNREDARRFHKQSASSPNNVIPAQRIELIRRMLEVDPSKRPTMEEVVTDPTFAKLSDEFERRSKGLAERGFYVDLNDAPRRGRSFSFAN